jgi:hypothetical protein
VTFGVAIVWMWLLIVGVKRQRRRRVLGFETGDHRCSPVQA